VDDLRRARAILGVPQATAPDRLRARYLELVKQWHPDRYSNDPQGQAEAEARMREINVAFHLLLAAAAPPATDPAHQASSPVPPQPTTPGQRLTREQIERLTEAIGTDGPLDWLLERSVESPTTALKALYVIIVGLGFVSLTTRGPIQGFRAVLLAAAAGGLLLEAVVRTVRRFRTLLRRDRKRPGS
jgi:DnaJ domain